MAGSLTVSESRLPAEFWVKVTPRSSRNEVIGWAEQVLRIRIRAAPVDGKANARLIEILSDYSGLPKSAFVLKRGHKSRMKLVHVKGA